MRIYFIVVSSLISLVACDTKKLKKLDLGKIEFASMPGNYESIELLKAYDAGPCNEKSETIANVYLVKLLSNGEQLFIIEPCREFPQLAARESRELEKRDLILVNAPPLTGSFVYISEDADIPAGSKAISGSLKSLSY